MKSSIIDARLGSKYASDKYASGSLFFPMQNQSSGGVLYIEKVFLEILQNSQENTCARKSFLMKLHA